MVLDVFDVVMVSNIGGKGFGEKDTNVGAYKRWAYKRWASPRPFVILVRLISIKYLFFKKKISTA